MKWTLIILIISIVIISGCASNKKCVQDSDCKSLNGCSAGCWNVNYKGGFCFTQISLAGPENCICHQNLCKDPYEVVREESSRDFENAFSLCEQYGIDKPRFVYECFNRLCTYAYERNIVSGRSKEEICEEKMAEAQIYRSEYT